jgi:hypothetical protein
VPQSTRTAIPSSSAWRPKTVNRSYSAVSANPWTDASAGFVHRAALDAATARTRGAATIAASRSAP